MAKAKPKTKKAAGVKRVAARKTCCACNENKLVRAFYRSRNPLHADGYLPMCTDCIKNSCYDELRDDVDIEKFKNILMQLDRPFVFRFYESALKEYDEAYEGKITPKGSRLRIIGYYMKNIQSLKQYQTMTWADGQRYGGDDFDGVIPKPGIRESLTGGSQVTYTLPRTETYLVTVDDIRLFGEGYTEKEYRNMRNKFDFLKENYPNVTNLHVEALADYVRLKVKAEIEIAKGNVADAKSWNDLATKAAEKAKINPNQLSQKDLQGGLNSFSETFQAIEQAVDVIPILPQFKYRPNDACDFVIWCFVNYIRKLEGKPICEYEDIYKFYDERKQEYIEQYGDPYGIFKEDTTSKNRDKIKNFIKIEDDYINE